MRRPISILLVLLVGGCSAQEGGESRDSRSSPAYEAQEEAPAPADIAPGSQSSTAGGPDIAPTAAPGVAFRYGYAFRLPAERIAEVQEQHARACEELGLARCRITGMLYRVVNEQDIEAMLAFRLEPTIARRFGRVGVEVVTGADGMLVESEITGTDVGTGIRTAGRNIAEMEDELARIEAELARGGKSTAERQQLEYQAQQLRQSIRAQRATHEEQQESLANTPMVFNYGSGDLVPGPTRDPTLAEAARQAWENFVKGLLILFVILVTLLPWAALAGLVILAIRIVRRRLEWRGAMASEEVSSPAET